MATVRPDFINVDLSVAGRANLEPLVRTLPQTARRLWNSARSRDFDIGIEVPRRGDSATLELPQDVVKLASSVRGQIHFTVYASNGRGSPPNKRLKLAARVD